MRHSSLTAEFSLNTPLFSSGANRAAPELRVSEIKAALRFWWRAMNYGLVDLSTGNCEALAARESELFGSTKGQSPFLLRLIENKVDVGQPAEAATLVPEGPARYLGYGLTEVDEENPTQRQGHNADNNTTFKIELTLKARAKPNEQQYINALKLFGLFGGLGYRSRRGFGSVTLQKLWINRERQELPRAIEAYGQLYGNLLHACPITTVPPEYSAFVKGTRFCRIVLLKKPAVPFDTGMKALASVAKQFRAVLTQRSDDGKQRLQNSQVVNSDDTSWAFMGLPRKYAPGDPESPMHTGRELNGGPGKAERRASPLLFHVHKAGNNDYRVVIVLFKSRFLPNNYGVQTAGAGNPQQLPVPSSSGYAWMDQWLVNSLGGTEIKSTGGPA